MPEGIPQQSNHVENADDNIELTAQDRERLALLYAEAGENMEMSMGMRDHASVEMRRRLRDEDGKAAAYIFELLERRATIDNFESYNDICLLDLCASERDAEKIGELLVRDDIALARDRSIKGRILEILTRIGTPENADHLLRFASKCFRAPSSGGFQRQDAMKAFNALFAINVRIDEENENAHGRIEDAMEDIKRTVHEHTGQEITSDEESEMGLSLLTGEVFTDFASFFEVLEPRESNDSPDSYDYFDSERNMSWEDEQDREMENDYYENKFTEVESRLEVIRRLHHEIKKEQEIKEDPEDEESKFIRRHWLEYREDNPSPYTPTLGIEIEIRERTIPLPEGSERWSDNERSHFLFEQKRREYEQTEALGVGRGNDAFWEFAHNPVRNYTTLSREVQALMEMGLINPDYPRHSLHITIGGISLGVSMSELYGEDGMSIEQAADSLMPESGKETFVLARTLEATGWSTTGGRLLRPYLTKGAHSAWAIKGVGGVKERPSHQIKLGVKKAVEFRTFQVQNFAGLDRTLRSAFLLGTALRAYQTEAQGAPLERDEDPVIREQLSQIWENFSHESRRIFSTYNLTDPQGAWHAPFHGDLYDDRAKNSFKKFGDVLDEARQHPQSRGAEFVAEMRGLIIKTRKQVADIIYKKIPPVVEEILLEK